MRQKTDAFIELACCEERYSYEITSLLPFTTVVMVEAVVLLPFEFSLPTAFKISKTSSMLVLLVSASSR